jgi:Xaa-Pro aminopeptidase
MTLAEARRARLLAAMSEADAAGLVLYGNAWHGDYLRYGSDFGILEGHGIAVVSADTTVDLFLDSATEAERAEAEVTGVTVHFAPDLARPLAARLARVTNGRLLAAPRRLLPGALMNRGVALDDGTALLDTLLMHKLPAEIDVIRRAAQLADDAYQAFRAAVRVGRPQYRVTAEIERYLRGCGCPDNFMIIGSGGKEVLRPGVTAGDVARAENDVFRRHGLGEYTTSRWTRVRGHGLGLFCDSKPHILEDVDTRLVPGMTLIIHPNTYHPEIGYMVLGDAVVVTENGAEVLTRTPRELFEVAA